MKKSVPTVEEYAQGFTTRVQTITGKLRNLIRGAVPGHIEAVYPGWKLIGYRAVEGRSSAYFAFIALFDDRVVLVSRLTSSLNKSVDQNC